MQESIFAQTNDTKIEENKAQNTTTASTNNETVTTNTQNNETKNA